MLYSVVLVSTVQQNESAIHIYTYIPSLGEMPASSKGLLEAQKTANSKGDFPAG